MFINIVYRQLWLLVFIMKYTKTSSIMQNQFKLGRLFTFGFKSVFKPDINVYIVNSKVEVMPVDFI